MNFSSVARQFRTLGQAYNFEGKRLDDVLTCRRTNTRMARRGPGGTSRVSGSMRSRRSSASSTGTS